MGERVETGGVMRFDYSGKEGRKISEKEKREIKEAYRKYYERKEREKKRRKLLWVIIALILIVVLGAVVLISR